MKSNLAPIILFAYKRPWHLQKTVEALLQNPLAKQSVLYIFSDGAKNEASKEQVDRVRTYIHKIEGFKEIIIDEKAQNVGLATSIIQGVTQVLEKHQRAIVLEDDMICGHNFLDFMNDGLDFYESDSRIFCTTGWSPPIKIPLGYSKDVYVTKRPCSWSWATWLDRWQKADWKIEDFEQFVRDPAAQKAFNLTGNDLTAMLKKQLKGIIDSWAVRWTYTLFKQQGYCVYPVFPKVHNIGTDGTGSHSPNTSKTDVEISTDTYNFVPQIEEDEAVLKSFRKFYRLSIIRKIINKITLG